MLRVFLVSLVLCFNLSRAYADTSKFHWDLLENVLSQIREHTESTGIPSPEQTNLLRTQIGLLVDNRPALDQVLTHLAGEGILEGRSIVMDMNALLETIKTFPTDSPEVHWLDSIGFRTLAERISEHSLTELETIATTDAPVPHSATMASPAAAMRTPEEPDTGSRSLLEQEVETKRQEFLTLAREVHRHLDVYRDVLQASEGLEKLVFKIHSIVFGLASTAALVGTSGLVDYGNLIPAQWVGMVGGIWAASSGTHFVIWKYLNYIESLKPVVLREEYRKFEESWTSLLALSPKYITRHAAAAASDIPTPPARSAGAKENYTLRALLKANTEYSTQELLEVGLQTEENGNTRRADLIFKEIVRRTEGSALSVKARRIREALRAKNRLENAIFYRQLTLATLRIAALGLGVWALNRGVGWALPAMVSRWRSVAFAIAGAVGSRRILEFLWQPLHEDRLDYLFERRREVLIKSFRALHEIDPSGELVSRMTRCNHSRTAHRYLTEAALAVLEEHPSHEVTKTIDSMLRREMGAQDINPGMAQNIARAAFRQYRRCQDQILKLVHGAREVVSITSKSLQTQDQQGSATAAP